MSFNGQQLEDIELIDFRRQQLINSEVEYRNYWSKVLRDGCLTMASLSILVVLLIASKGEDCGEGMRFILTFTIVLKLSLLIPVEIIYLCLINFKCIRPSNIQLIKLFSVVPCTSWYIYACIKFFHSSNACKQQSVPLYIGNLLIVIEAFLMFFVIGLCTLVVFCLLVILIFVRNSEIQEQQKNVKIKDILLSVASLKLDPNQFTSNDDCAICYDEFSNGQAIIRLPCNAKHYFHAECIGNWIERKTECPICKAQITEEILDKFKHAEPNKEDFSKERRLDSNFELN